MVADARNNKHRMARAARRGRIYPTRSSLYSEVGY